MTRDERIDLFYFGAVVSLLIGAGFAAYDFNKRPTVKFSWSKDRCVEVLNYDQNHQYTCNNLPRGYESVWVK